ncbi:hypothetical protein FHG87_001515 [Trinorchestia longiramus]|nr:hypothetical protein FHG87_001515 [Trinorchestia longiramus]
MRAERSCHILNEIAQGTLPNVFTDEKKIDLQEVVNHQNDRIWSSSSSVEGRIVTRRQNAQSVMVWAAVIATERFPLDFVSCGVKLNSERYISLILESKLLPWATEHFQGLPSSLQRTVSTGFSAIPWLQHNPNLDSEEHFIFHKQRCMVSKDFSIPGLLYLVHFGDKSLSYPSPLTLLSSPSKQNCNGNGKQFHKNRFVPLAMHL